MSRKLEADESRRALEELHEQGWCVLDQVFDASEGRRAVSLLERVLAPEQRTILEGYGAKIYTLFARVPEMRAMFVNSALHEFLCVALGSQPTFPRNGARISNVGSIERIPWHHHFGWEARVLLERERFERLVAICYVHGSDAARGPLVGKPRGFRTPLQEPPPDALAPFGDERVVEAPPLSAVVMDTAVLHCSLRPTQPLARWIWGAHAQAGDVVRPHAEDERWSMPITETLRRWERRFRAAGE